MLKKKPELPRGAGCGYLYVRSFIAHSPNEQSTNKLQPPSTVEIGMLIDVS
jgi:hypothetical protein